ncbi:hypothetical protein KI659_17970 [Litoribacter alkaliphilus]|uniref:DUF3168 domain-containing protein n=1 Tax=Litoribacter ruber TaxID=702568 RepID=A0AAP2CJI0_9BACT|nr:hypothetical protein [Litoribacter alkaliphilus]MBS9525913.1 hypothetical protein [Litoribacter alkaliphilus]
MTVTEAIYHVLSESEELKAIFNDRIFPLSTKKQKLPSLFYQIFILDVNHSKTGGSKLDEYALKLHLFSLDNLELTKAQEIVRNLLDFKEITDDEGNTLIEYFRFTGYTNDYLETDEVFNATVNFTFFTARN